ncbi:hypothetical protein NMG60_11000719 [Bertholletia excelsa]
MTGSSCGACKFLRRRCRSECVFAPYFCYDEAMTHFAAVHKVFGASNVAKLLGNLPVHHRREAAITVSYEALARVNDPIYGCVAQIFALQQQVASLAEEIETLENQMASIQFDVSSFRNTQAIDSFSNELRASSQLNKMDAQTYLSQQPEVFSYQMFNASENHGLYSQMSLQLPAMFELEDLTSVPLEKLLEGIDQGIFTSYPWIE